MERRCHLNTVQKEELGFNKQIKERAGRVEGENGREAWPGHHRVFQTPRRGDSAWSRGEGGLLALTPAGPHHGGHGQSQRSSEQKRTQGTGGAGAEGGMGKKTRQVC